MRALDTAQRAALLAQTLCGFPQLGKIAQEDLLALLDAELGSRDALDRFCPHSPHITKLALAPKSILHVCSGNLSNPGIMSLTFGLLLGSKNLVKLPRANCAELERFIQALPPELAQCVQTTRDLTPGQIAGADAVIVYGSDETCGKLRAQVGWNRKFIAYGHRLSFGIVFREGISDKMAEQIAWDASVYDQQGCLSPHDVYVQEGGSVSPEQFAAQIARAFEKIKLQVSTPDSLQVTSVICGKNLFGVTLNRTLEEQAEILRLRSSYSFRAANDPRVKIWRSEADDFWTVIYEEEKQFATSCLNRVLFVKPFRELAEIVEATALIRPHLSTVGIAPVSALPEQFARELGALRYCPIGTMQKPPLHWLHDGRPNLADLVTWVEWEEST
ncbi:acyl-CoA reductase [Oscillatoria laete-virens NRMC-F 0139]|nr:acyl-CoA reductase [Oscillatoria laete-virens]MDL5055762.1 acyl-CoA reductase [Oscillatoria laete-virens NRMC-F 0139]